MQKKVLILSHSFPVSETDYRGRFILDYIKSDDNKSIKVLAPHLDRSFIENKWGTEIHYFKWHHGYFAGMKIWNPFHLFFFLKMVLTFVFSARKIMWENEIDQVFACWAVPAGISAFLLKIFCGVKYSVWALGTDINKFINIPFLLPVILKNAHMVYANSRDLEKKIVERCGVKCQLLPTRSSLPSPVIPDKPLTFDKSLNVAFVGRLEKVKGIDYFLDIAEKVREKRKDISFTVFGDGSYSDVLKDYCNRSIVRWAGEVGCGELAYYSDFIDVLLITSRSESMPVVFWEFGKLAKILSFPVGDIPQYLDPQFVLDDVESMVSYLVNYEP